MTFSITSIGEGRDLVLIHGWAMHSGIFAPLVDRLKSRFRLHLVDLPGHGASREFTAGALDPAMVAKQIAERTPPAIWLGWSLGGLVGLRGALDFPAQVHGLIEIAASPRFITTTDWTSAVSPKVFRSFHLGLEVDFDTAIDRFLALETLGSPNARDALRCLREQIFERGKPSRAALHEGLDLLDSSDLRAELAQLSQASLWISGRRDRIVPSAGMQWAAEHSPRGQFLELDAGHAPFLSQPAEVASAIEAFSDSVMPA